jgi:cell division protease FtsH
MNRHERRVKASRRATAPAQRRTTETSAVATNPPFFEHAPRCSQGTQDQVAQDRASQDIGSNDVDPLPKPDAEDSLRAEPGAEPQQSGRQLMYARDAIIGAALGAASTPAQRRLWRKPTTPTAIVVLVPATSWVTPVERYFIGLEARWVTFARSGSIKARDKADVGNDEIAAWLAKGRHVVGIAADSNMLPSCLVAAADMTINVAPPNGEVIKAAMKRCLRGRAPAAIDAAVASGLDLDDLVSAFRPGSSPSQVIERLRAATKSHQGLPTAVDLPDLSTAVEYGAARVWGLALARDITDYRAGRISWTELDRGAVLHSAPGFGKSFYARVLAHFCNIPLVVFSVSALFANSRGDLDGVIKEQRSFFEKAARLADPRTRGCCLLFCDEIDAVPNRFALSSRNSDWWLPVITDFMMLLDDSVGSREGVIVLGATNRPQAIDPAITRPGRLERFIEIGRPDAAGVQNILRYHLKGNLLGADLTEVSQMLEGSTAAELMELVRAARRVARQAQRELTVDDLRERVIGLGESLSPDRLRRIAVHEAAHAVSAVVIPVGTLLRVQLRAQGGSGGHTRIEHTEQDIDTLADIENRVTWILAAAVAERVILNSVSTGSGGDSNSSDLGIATTMLAVLHCSTAVTGNLFHRCSPAHALETARADPRLRRIIEGHLRALELRAEALVLKHRDAIVAVADELARARYLSGDAVRAIVAGFPPRAPAVRRPARRRLH